MAGIDFQSSSDNSEESNQEDEVDDNSREKRDSEWCSVLRKPKITWPPPRLPSNNYRWRNLRPIPRGNPKYGNKMQLFSRTNYNLAVYADGQIRGTDDDDDLHTHLELVPVGHPGQVRIQGILTKLYVGMDPKGKLYGEPDVTNESTIFIESFRGQYNTYLSLKYAHLGWYLGIKKSGKFKKGPLTSYKQKAVQFLPRRSRFE